MRISFFILIFAFASQASESDNDRHLNYGDGKNNDGAAYVGDQKTKQQLTPHMTQHYAQSQMYYSMGNFAMGGAEKAKGDMLKKQIDENKKTADKNRESEKLVKRDSDEMENANDARIRIITVDKSRLQNPEPSSPNTGTSPSEARLLTATPSASAPVTQSNESSTTSPKPNDLVSLDRTAAPSADAPTPQSASTTSPSTSDVENTISSGADSETTRASSSESQIDSTSLEDSRAGLLSLLGVGSPGDSFGGAAVPESLQKDFFTAIERAKLQKRRGSKSTRPVATTANRLLDSISR